MIEATRALVTAESDAKSIDVTRAVLTAVAESCGPAKACRPKANKQRGTEACGVGRSCSYGTEWGVEV